MIFLMELYATNYHQMVIDKESCFSSNEGVEILEKPYSQFRLPLGNQCRDYCLVDDNCLSFVSTLKSLDMCSLYNQTISYRDNIQRIVLIGQKGCLLKKHFLSTKEEIKSTQKGVVLRKSGSNKSIAVDLKGIGKKLLNGTLSKAPIFWMEDSEQRWNIHFHEDQGDLVGCYNVTIQLKGANYCITTGSTHEDRDARSRPPIFLQSCINQTNQLAEPQILWLCYSYFGMYWSLGMPILVAYIKILDRVEIKKSPCRTVSVLNGTVLIEDSVPFFLPSETFTVKCNKGFAIDTGNGTYHTQLQGKCKHPMAVFECQPIVPEPPIGCSSVPRSPTTFPYHVLLVLIVGLALC